ncbi:MAG: biopolymer transporter ExbD, partial [Gemmatimonas sp.]
MGMSVGGGGGVKAEPNVTPMIGVMLLLLIIFMITVPQRHAGFKSVRPQGKTL